MCRGEKYPLHKAIHTVSLLQLMVYSEGEQVNYNQSLLLTKGAIS